MSDTAEADSLILQFDPFEGDFGMPSDKVFSNKMVIARKPGPCAHCGLEIQKGERVRSQSSKFDGELMAHRWCALCCEAMVLSFADFDEDDEYTPPWEVYELRSGLARKQTEASNAG